MAAAVPGDLPIYIIVDAGGPQELAREVNKKIQQGYVPVGGVAMDNSYSAYMQAMMLGTRNVGGRKTKRHTTS